MGPKALLTSPCPPSLRVGYAYLRLFHPCSKPHTVVLLFPGLYIYIYITIQRCISASLSFVPSRGWFDLFLYMLIMI